MIAREVLVRRAILAILVALALFAGLVALWPVVKPWVEAAIMLVIILSGLHD